MPEEINAVETIEKNSIGIGGYLAGALLLVAGVACAFAFAPRHLKKDDEPEYTVVEGNNKTENTAENTAENN